MLFQSTFAKSLTGVLYQIERKIAEIRLYCFIMTVAHPAAQSRIFFSFGGAFVVSSRWRDAEIDKSMSQISVPPSTIEIPTLIVLKSNCKIKILL